MLRRLWFAAAVGVALLAVACSKGTGPSLPAAQTPVNAGSAQPQAGEELSRTGEAGGVTVEATWLTESALSEVDADLSRYPLDDFVLLEVKLDTHSGDLNEIDMEREPALRQGGAELSPQAWVSVSDDAHHREGVLVFAREMKDGPLELALGIGDKEVALLWEAAPGT